MKKLLFFFFGLTMTINASAQNSLFLPDAVNWVNLGDLDVPGNQLTVEALIQYTGPSVNILSKHTDPSNVNYLLRIGSFEITTTQGFAAFSGVAAAGVQLEVGRTYHVAATYNGSFLRYYVNGCLTGEMEWSGNMIQNNIDAAIGQQSTNETEQFRGYIDELRIWNVARTQEQIANNMLDLPDPTNQTGLMAYYKFESNFVNVQGNATWNGTAVGNPEFETIPYPYPTELGVTASSSPVVCNDTETGAIDIAGNGGYLPYEYSVDGTTFSGSPAFENLAPGEYTVFARSNENCVASTTVIVENNDELDAQLTSNAISCNGADDGSATINPIGGNGGPFNHAWWNGEDEELSVSDLSPGSYSVSVSDSCKLSGNELVVNGHFENGNEDFSTDYNYCDNCLANQNNLPGGDYIVGYDASVHHNAFVGTGNGGSGNFLIVNGAEQANTNVWCQEVDVQPDTYYVFSSWVSSIFADSPAELQFSVNGEALGPIFTAPSTTGTWERFFGTWYSGTNTTATICIVNQNTEPAGNDFGIDDISFKICVSCEIEETFSISEPDELTLEAELTNPQCNEADGAIELTAGGGTPTYSYSIDDGDSFQLSPIFSDLAPGEYTLIVKDNNDCEKEITVNLENEGDPTVSAGDPVFVCSGESVTLTGDGAVSYTWSDGVEDGVPFVPTQTNEYTVTGTDEFGCTSSDEVLVTVFDLPSISAGSDVSVCEGQDVILAATGGETYTWDVSAPNNSTVLPSETTTFTVVGVDENGCEASDSFTATVNPLPNVSGGVNQTVCDGEEVILTGSGGTSYVWDNGVINGQPFTQPVGTTTYTVIGTDANGCQNTATVDVTVIESPDANFSVTPDFGTVPLEVTIDNSSGSTGSFSWDFDDGTTSNENNFPFNHTYNDTGVYVIQVFLESNGCIGFHEEVVIVVLEDISFEVPNVFTPNNDGVNDSFKLKNLKGVEQISSFDIVIVNRWGNNIVQYNTPLFEWNGTSSGQRLQDGVYFYKIEYTNQIGETSIKNGFVHLVRQ